MLDSLSAGPQPRSAQLRVQAAAAAAEQQRRQQAYATVAAQEAARAREARERARREYEEAESKQQEELARRRDPPRGNDSVGAVVWRGRHCTARCTLSMPIGVAALRQALRGAQRVAHGSVRGIVPHNNPVSSIRRLDLLATIQHVRAGAQNPHMRQPMCPASQCAPQAGSFLRAPHSGCAYVQAPGGGGAAAAAGGRAGGPSCGATQSRRGVYSAALQ